MSESNNNETNEPKTKKQKIVEIFLMLHLIGWLIIIVLAYTVIGLVLWEIAPYIAFLSIPFLLAYIVRFIRIKKGQLKKASRELAILGILFSCAFQVWAYIPVAQTSQIVPDFDLAMENALGKDYLDKIPSDMKKLMKTSPFEARGLITNNGYNKRIDLEDLPYTQQLRVKYGLGSQQYMHIYSPKNFSGLRPGLVMIHGGAASSISDNEGIAENNTAMWFTRLGFIVFSIEYTMDNVAMPSHVFDVRTAVAWLHQNAASLNLNPDQLCAWGRSRGGHLATVLAYGAAKDDSWQKANAGNFTKEQLKIKAVVDLYGAVNPKWTGEWGNDFLAKRNEVLFNGTPSELPHLYGNLSASNLVSVNSPPTFIMHGRIDKMVHKEESTHLYAELQKKNVTSIYLEVPSGQHGFDAYPSTAGGQLMYYYAERFLLYQIYN
jgi:acetyl esterase/lipase